jgi:predicted aspartyl protease
MAVPISIVEHEEMGRVLTEALVENLRDLFAVEEGRAQPEAVRHVALTDALVDTGATTLALPVRYVRQLGLSKKRERSAVSPHGRGPISIYEPVRLTIQGRDCVVEVMEVPDEVPALIGQIPLEMLDFVIDPQSRRLIGNPAHGGEQMLEVL